MEAKGSRPRFEDGFFCVIIWLNGLKSFINRPITRRFDSAPQSVWPSNPLTSSAMQELDSAQASRRGVLSFLPFLGMLLI